MVFTIGDLWDTLGRAGGKIKKFDWGVQERAKGMTIPQVFEQEAYKMGRFPSQVIIAGGKGVVSPFAEVISPYAKLFAPKRELTTEERATYERIYAPTAKEFGLVADPYKLPADVVSGERTYTEAAKQKAVEMIPWLQEPPAWYTADPTKLMPDIDLSQLGVAEGMAAMGQALAAALAGMKPEITVPTGLTDEEGKIPPAILIGAAAVGLGAIYLIGRK